MSASWTRLEAPGPQNWTAKEQSIRIRACDTLLRESRPTQVYDKVISAPAKLRQRAPAAIRRCPDEIRKIRPMLSPPATDRSCHVDGLNAS